MGRHLIKAVIFGLALAGSLAQVSSQEQAAATRVLVRTQGGEITAEMPNQPDWCRPDLTFTVRAQEDIYLNGLETDQQGNRGRLTLQKVLGGLRVGLQSECPQAKSVTFNGFVDDVFVYRGYAEKGGAKGDWVLVELPVNLVNPPDSPAVAAPPTPSAPPAPRLAAVGECDGLAAHPDDPKRPKSAAGVTDDDMKAGQAAETCEEALAVEPGNARIRYQLARAYLLFGKPAEGVEKMTEAAEEGHAAAIASLGDFVLYGLLDDEPDPETAKLLYQRAAKAGFKPAAKLAEAIQGNPQEDKTQEVAAEPAYIHANYAQTVLAGVALPEKGAALIRLLSYSSGFIGGIRHHCPEFEVDVNEKRILQVVMNQGLFASLAASEEVQQDGMDDGYALAATKGCGAKEVMAAKATVEKTYQ